MFTIHINLSADAIMQIANSQNHNICLCDRTKNHPMRSKLFLLKAADNNITGMVDAQVFCVGYYHTVLMFTCEQMS